MQNTGFFLYIYMHMPIDCKIYRKLGCLCLGAKESKGKYRLMITIAVPDSVFQAFPAVSGGLFC